MNGKWLKIVTLSMMILALAMTFALAQTTIDGQKYTVQTNDSLWKLADKYLGDGNLYPAIVDATNAIAAQDETIDPITNPDVIRPGQTLWIPDSAGESPVADTPAPVATATSSPTVANAATATPPPSMADGTPTGHIAFSFWNDSPERCTYEINIVSVPDCLAGDDSCQATRRILPLNNVSEPALSADGTRIMFRSWGQPPSDESPYLNCAPAHPFRHLGHSDMNGELFRSVTQYWEDAHADWSPDSGRIIYDTDRLRDGTVRIFAVSADGEREENLLIAGQYPSWAPDSQRFVYRGCDVTGQQCGLWTALAYDPKSWARGQNQLQAITIGDGVAHPDWSPVGEEIVYQRLENGVWNLWLVNSDGSDDRPLTSSPIMAALPAFSPDGQWIAYLTNNGGVWEIHIVSRDGGDDRRVFTFDGGKYTVPQPVEPYGPRDWIDEQISWSQ